VTKMSNIQQVKMKINDGWKTL